MSFTGLRFQLRNAEKQGYSDESIRSAIINAIEDPHVKSYLERKPDISIDETIDFLRPHFIQKDSSEYFTELGEAKQKSDETPLQFLNTLLSLKQTILELSIEEEEPFDESRLSKPGMYLHA